MDMKFLTLQFAMAVLIGYALCTWYPGPGRALRAKFGV